MSVTLMGVAWRVNLAISEKLVLLALADSANDEGICWPSVSSLYKKCSLSERSVRQAIGNLSEAGHLTIHERSGRSNYYTVHPRPALHTPANGAGVPLQTLHPSPATGAPPPLQPVHPTPANAAPINIIEPSVEPSGKRERGERSRKVPSDFEVTDQLREWAAKEVPTVDLAAETAKFRDHEFDPPKSDWAACWRQWMRRAPEFKPRNGARFEDTGWKPDPNNPRHVPKAERVQK